MGVSRLCVGSAPWGLGKASGRGHLAGEPEDGSIPEGRKWAALSEEDLA